MKYNTSLKFIFLVTLSLYLGSIQNLLASSQTGMSFQEYVDRLKVRAGEKGIRAITIDQAFADVVYKERIVELDQKQPEGVWTFERYRNAVIPEKRIAKGRMLYKKYKNDIEKLNGGLVPAEYVIALWGMESDFGRNMGGFNVIEATATLAYEGRRKKFFEEQLFAALEILDDNHISADKMLGSFQGAMGQCQFMPTSYQSLAQDGDGDGKRDIWTNKKDIFASISHYLIQKGWITDQGVGYLFTNNQYKGDNGTKIMLDETNQWPYVKYDNFNVLKKWNNSNKFAAAVGLFADQIKMK